MEAVDFAIMGPDEQVATIQNMLSGMDRSRTLPKLGPPLLVCAVLWLDLSVGASKQISSDFRTLPPVRPG